MDIKTQEKVSKLLREQAEKLAIAIKALKKVRDMQKLSLYRSEMQAAADIVNAALREIGDYGKNPEDL